MYVNHEANKINSSIEWSNAKRITFPDRIDVQTKNVPHLLPIALPKADPAQIFHTYVEYLLDFTINFRFQEHIS